MSASAAAPKVSITPGQLRAWAAMERRGQECRGNLVTFMNALGRDAQGNPVRFDWEGHAAWNRHIDYCWSNNLRCLIMGPVGHGKSSLVVMLAAWLLGNDVQRRIKIVCSGDELATERVRSIKQILEAPAFRTIFPWVRPGEKWSDGDLLVHRRGQSPDPSVQAKGVASKGYGKRADVLLFDDVCDQNNSAEEVQRKRVRNLVEQTWLSRLEKTSSHVLYVCNPWHVDDCSHVLMRTPGWCSLIQGVNADCSAHELEVVGALPGIPYPIGGGQFIGG